MNFVSTTFIAFFILVFTAFWLIKPPLLRKILLIIASYLFYSWVHPSLGIFLSAYTLINFFLINRIQIGGRERKAYYISALLLNLASLLFFKYFGVIGEKVANLIYGFGLLDTEINFNLILPLGISFFSLQIIGYMTDVYRRTYSHKGNLLDFSLYVALFPQLVAGPIERAKSLGPQIAALRTWSWERFNSGWKLVLLGYLNKVVIADNVGILVDKVFILEKPTLLLLAAGSLAFTLQIYADFTAYTNLALGFGKLIGFDFTENFNSPYLSISPSDFWNRWHISFSSWLRDYIFFPVQRWARSLSMKKKYTVFVSAMAAMLVSGVWHGVGLTFIVWGAYFGLLLSLYQWRELDSRILRAGRSTKVIAWAVNFLLIVAGWAIFRSPSLGWLLNTFRTPQFGIFGDSLITGSLILVLTAFYAGPMVLKRLLKPVFTRYQWVEYVYYVSVVAAIVVFGLPSTHDFIYINF